MRIEDILKLPPPTTQDQMDRIVDLVLCSEELLDVERGSFILGYCYGVATALAKQDDPVAVVDALSTRMAEWTARDWI